MSLAAVLLCSSSLTSIYFCVCYAVSPMPHTAMGCLLTRFVFLSLLYLLTYITRSLN